MIHEQSTSPFCDHSPLAPLRGEGLGLRGDQAEGLRRRADVTSPGNLPWPRLVIVSEFPQTDAGVRFAFHLACALGNPRAEEKLSASGGSNGQVGPQNLLIDLAPAVSRLPHVMRDCACENDYPLLWRSLAASRPLSVLDLRQRFPLSVAAEAQPVPCAIDQMPRLYEQLVRQLGRQGERFRWIVLLALDSVLPLDRACWQAADDVVLLSGADDASCRRHTAALRARIEEHEPQRTLWTLPKRTVHWGSGWVNWPRHTKMSRRSSQMGIASNSLQSVGWPLRGSSTVMRSGSRADTNLLRSAQGVAQQLRLSAASQTGAELAEINGAQKKIQLGALGRPIKPVTEESRA